jgi:molybdenum cofactor cytidylyltransferase
VFLRPIATIVMRLDRTRSHRPRLASERETEDCMKNYSLVILAAGNSSRMRGAHKLLQPIGDEGLSLIGYLLQDIESIDCLEKLLILGARGEEISGQVKNSSIRQIYNPNFSLGMHSSIRSAVLAIDPHSIGIVLCLGDQPFRLAERIERLVGGRSLSVDSLLRSTVDGEPGHPVFIGRRYFPRILEQGDADHGCHYLFKEFSFEVVSQSAEANWDLDSPEDFQKLRESRGKIF